MIRALFLIFQPEWAWERVARRPVIASLLFYFLPTLLIIGVVEGFGLTEWGRYQSEVVGIKRFPLAEAVSAELLQLLALCVVVMVSTYFLKAIFQTFHTRHSFAATLTLVLYGLAPVFLCRLLDIFPTLSLWIPWALGIGLTTKILYHGVPKVLDPDPPQALGLFFMSVLVLAMVTASERFISVGYLTGKFRPVSEAVAQIMAHLLHKGQPLR